MNKEQKQQRTHQLRCTIKLLTSECKHLAAAKVEEEIEELNR